MTRRQWMWLWIWLLIFFIIFCIWDKLQALSTDTPIKQPIQNVIVPQTQQKAPIKEVEKVAVVDMVKKRDINFKVVKQDDKTIKISGLFSSQSDIDILKSEYQKIAENVEEGTIIIDENTDNSKLLEFLPTLTNEFSKFKNGYIEYADKHLIVDGIAVDENVIATIEELTKDNKLFTLENRVTTAQETEPEAPEPKEEPAPKLSVKDIQAQLDSILKMKKVEFVYAKDILTNESKGIVNEVQNVLSKYKDISVEIGGHTDSDGSQKNNKALSQKRADAIKKYLVSKDIDKDRLKSIGYGEAKPLVKNNSSANKQINRRVEFKIIEE